MTWTPERQSALERMAKAGMTGSEIAEALSVSRGAVMGRAHRTGVKLPVTEAKAAHVGRKKAAAAVKRWADPEFKARVGSIIRRRLNEPDTRARHLAALRANAQRRVS